jgi:hypothetical protein
MPAAAVRVVMSARDHPAVLPAEVGAQHLRDAPGDTCGYVDAKTVEYLDGPWSHSAGDDDISAELADEAGHRSGLVRPEVRIGYHL